jgi:hypothetical protein
MAGLKRDSCTKLEKVILALGPSSDLAVLGWEYPRRASVDCVGIPRGLLDRLDTDSAGNRSIMRFDSGAPV